MPKRSYLKPIISVLMTFEMRRQESGNKAQRGSNFKDGRKNGKALSLGTKSLGPGPRK